MNKKEGTWQESASRSKQDQGNQETFPINEQPYNQSSNTLSYSASFFKARVTRSTLSSLSLILTVLLKRNSLSDILNSTSLLINKQPLQFLLFLP